MRFLMILGQDVTIKVSKAKKTKANIHVIAPQNRTRPMINNNEVAPSRSLHAKKRK